MDILTVEDCGKADRMAAAVGVPGIALMEAAGLAVTLEILRRFDRRPVCVLCGPGNNGGDGYVIARLLARRGWPVRVAAMGDAADLPPDAAVNARRWRQMGRPVHPLEQARITPDMLVVDALFGAGLTRPVEGPAAEALEQASDTGAPVVAVDVPSGVEGNTGAVLGEVAPACALTVTFFRPKPAHVLYPGSGLCGEVVVADIGIPDDVMTALAPVAHLNMPGLWDIPPLSPSGHKYGRGMALVFGTVEMNGAARLAARAARRVGAGLLITCAPEEVRDIYMSDDPGLMFWPTAEDGESAGVLAEKRFGALLVGPGFPVSETTRQIVRGVWSGVCPVVLDAGALTSYADQGENLFKSIRNHGRPVVLTPHEGEFARLFGDLPGDKIARTRQAAEISGAIVVLKGPDTVIAAPDGTVAVNANAPPWLATAGSGDVLAGFVTGLLARGMDAWEAACAAVWLHGEAAVRGGSALIAEDLPEAVTDVMRSLDEAGTGEKA